jgi:hypothetical protein
MCVGRVPCCPREPIRWPLRLTGVTRASATVAGLAVLGGCLACGSPSHGPRAITWAALNPQPPRLVTGTVHGRVAGFGGPYPGTVIAPGAAGTVTLTGTHHRASATFDAQGWFTAVLPPGTYTLHARAFDGVVCTGTVHVVAHRATSADAVCPVP